MRHVLLICLCELLIPVGMAQEADIKKQLETYLNANEATGKFRGSVLVAKSDSVLLHKGYGLADQEKRMANTPETVYLIGSVTKTFTALMVVKLAQEGRLLLSDNVGKLVSGIDRGDRITIHQLLTHTSGLPDYHRLDDWMELGQGQVSPRELLEMVSERLEPDFEPGERFRYCNTGYIILGLIIEQLEGAPFQQVLQSRVCDPLGLDQTGVRQDYLDIPGMAKGYQSTVRDTVQVQQVDLIQPFSSGNMYSTVADLYDFMKALSRSRLLDSHWTKEMLSGHEFGSYGYGVGIRDEGKRYGHTGRMNGCLASMNWQSEGDFFVMIICNDEYAPLHTITEGVFAILNGQPCEMPQKRIPIALSEAAWDQYAGDYLIRAGDTLHVWTEAEQLFMQETGQAKLEIYPRSERVFFFDQLESEVVFEDWRDGTPQRLVLRWPTREIPASRLSP